MDQVRSLIQILVSLLTLYVLLVIISAFFSALNIINAATKDLPSLVATGIILGLVLVFIKEVID